MKKIKTYNNFLNEASIYNIKQEDIMTPTFIEEIQLSDNYERYLDEYIVVNRLEDEDEDEVQETEEFKEWFRYELRYRYDNVLDTLTSVIKEDNTIDIWRVMTVNDDWLSRLDKTGKHLGIYWSWNMNAAEAHWGYDENKNNELLIKSNVKEKYINWDDTIKVNMDYTLGDDEKEIRLYKNTPLKIEIVSINGEEMNMINLTKNKTFYS